MPVISTNTAANSALRYLNLNADEQTSTISKLASGSRITRASDDAAGLAIATRVESDVTALNQAATNASQAISILQTADGGLARIADILQRMKALASQSNSGSVTDTERAYIQEEYSALASEITGISSSTSYNGEPLLATGDYVTGVNVMVGTSATDTISLKTVAADATTLGIAAGTVATQAGAVTQLGLLDTAIGTISSARASVGALMSRFEFRSENIATGVENLSAAESAIMDADVASEQSKLSSSDVKTQAAIAALAQANQLPQNLLKLMQ